MKDETIHQGKGLFHLIKEADYRSPSTETAKGLKEAFEALAFSSDFKNNPKQGMSLASTRGGIVSGKALLQCDDEMFSKLMLSQFTISASHDEIDKIKARVKALDLKLVINPPYEPLP